MLAALDERQDDGGQADGHEHGAGDVDPARALGARLGHERAASASAATPIGTLMRKQLRQPEAGDVGLHEHAADELAADGGEAEDDAVDAQRADAVGAL